MDHVLIFNKDNSEAYKETFIVYIICTRPSQNLATFQIQPKRERGKEKGNLTAARFPKIYLNKQIWGDYRRKIEIQITSFHLSEQYSP